MTNIGRLREMTDRELASYHAAHCSCPPGEDPAFHEYACNMGVLGCVDCWDKWLHEEATE